MRIGIFIVMTIFTVLATFAGEEKHMGGVAGYLMTVIILGFAEVCKILKEK